jgi:putative ABC transport system permease protein
MILLKILFKNAFRNRLRAALTILGITIAILAFGLLRISSAQYERRDLLRHAAGNPNAVSRTSLCPSYYGKIRQIDGSARLLCQLVWHLSTKTFFPNLAVEPRTYLALFPEYLHSEGEKQPFWRTGRLHRPAINWRPGGWKIGDLVTLRDHLSRAMEFVLRGIYRGGIRISMRPILLSRTISRDDEKDDAPEGGSGGLLYDWCLPGGPGCRGGPGRGPGLQELAGGD